MGLFNSLLQKTKNIANNVVKEFSDYDLDTKEGIASIPNKQNLLKSFESGAFPDNILSKLQKKATEHMKNGNIDLAIACLEKSLYIMLNSDYYYRDYADRYIKYLKNDRQFDKARQIEKMLLNWEKKQSSGIEEYIISAKKLGTDLVEADYPKPCDCETAKYRGRIFSISGKDKRFPVLTEEIKLCGLNFYPFIYGISEPNYCPKGEEVAFSNRPFIDDRTEKEKNSFNDAQKKVSDSKNCEDEYYWIYEHLPDIAPKSLSGYTRMKKSNSKNYQTIKEAAREKGYILS